MPTYDYKCKGCGNKFEVRQNMNDEPIKICPECGGEVRKLLYSKFHLELGKAYINGVAPFKTMGAHFQNKVFSILCGFISKFSRRGNYLAACWFYDLPSV